MGFGDICMLVVTIGAIIAISVVGIVFSVRTATRLDAETTCGELMIVGDSHISEYALRREAFSNDWILRDHPGQREVLRFERGILFDTTYDIVYSRDRLPNAEARVLARTSVFEPWPEFFVEFQCVLPRSTLDFEINYAYGSHDAEVVVGDPAGDGRSRVWAARQGRFDRDPTRVQQNKLTFHGVTYGDRDYLDGLSLSVLKLIRPAVDTFRVCIGTDGRVENRTAAEELDYAVAGAVTALSFNYMLEKEAAQRDSSSDDSSHD